ncbi:MAG: hypothetical protein HY077_00740 [Elusimicrobia bacterium]|nr:hypothetical protein [Elusimicrobiota bacterium]
MKNYAIVLLSVSMLAGAARAHEGHGEKAMKEGVESHSETMTGEVLDLACYMAEGGKGEKHAQCAKDCLAEGAPAGLLSNDGKVYVLVNDHKQEQGYKDARALGGQKAAITGKVAKRGGLPAFIVEKAEKAGK